MHTVRRFLVTILVPAVIVSIFAVGAAAANGSDGKVDLCHWANHKFVEISVSMSAKPAHLGHGDVEPDEYGDCAGGEQGDEERDDDDDGDSDAESEAGEGGHDERGDRERGDRDGGHDGKDD